MEDQPVAPDVVEFDVESGPYDEEFLSNMGLDELLAARGLLRKAQTEAGVQFMRDWDGRGISIPSEEFHERNLEGSVDIWLPKIETETGDIEYRLVDRRDTPEIYTMREKALALQNAPEYRAHIEEKKDRLLNSLRANPRFSNIQLEVTPFNEFFNYYGVVDGTRRLLAQLPEPGY